MYKFIIACVLFLNFFTSADAQTTTFIEDFDRPDGSVGNGWSNTTGNVNGDLLIRDGRLSTPRPDGHAGIHRPINLSGPVTVSATLTHMNGFGGLLNRYGTSFRFGTTGALAEGYTVTFSRGDQNFPSIVGLGLNGVGLIEVNSSFQFGASISASVIVNPDGSVTGSVAGDGNSFNFSFPPRPLVLPGSNLSVVLGFPDSRSGVITHATVDDLTITEKGSGFLSFPLRGTKPGEVLSNLNPYNVTINSVFDHSLMDAHGNMDIYGCDDIVQAYTGETGSVHGSGLDKDGFKIRCRQGYAEDGSHAPFYVNGSYAGGGDKTHLYYDGHPGVDFQGSLGTELYAAVSGTVNYPENIVGLRTGGKAYKLYHVLELVPDTNPNYRIYYLHLLTHPSTGATEEKADNSGGACPAQVTLPLPKDTHVEAGCLVALVGNAGPKNTPAHLHLEVAAVVPLADVPAKSQRLLQCIFDETKACVPVDPYGWDAAGQDDPLQELTGVANVRLWQHQPVVKSISPTAAASGILDLTINGAGLDGAVVDYLVRKSDLGVLPAGITLSQTSGQLVVRKNLSPGIYFVGVKNGTGRISNWMPLTVK